MMIKFLLLYFTAVIVSVVALSMDLVFCMQQTADHRTVVIKPVLMLPR